MNDLMSLGIHRLWKDKMVSHLPDASGSLLDVAGGTGDISVRYYQKALKQGHTPNIHVCDINRDMVAQGRDRALDQGITCHIHWNCGNAESLPYPDLSFDYYTIAFGIRNVTHIEKALEEAYRVLKPGGKFVCLEFSQVKAPILRDIYEHYSFHCIPKIGGLVAGDKESYQYLVESIRRFPSQEDFLQMIRNAGFHNAQYENLTAGVTALHYGWRV